MWGRVEGVECGRVEVGLRAERCDPLRVSEFICGVPGAPAPGRSSAFL